MTKADAIRDEIRDILKRTKTSILIMMLGRRSIADEVLGPALADLHEYQRDGMLEWAADAVLEEIDRRIPIPGQPS